MYARVLSTLLSALLASQAYATIDFVDCSKMTVAGLNAKPESCADLRLNPECLSKFNAKGLNHPCIEKIKPAVLENLHDETVKQITSDPKEIPRTKEIVHVFLIKKKFWSSEHEKELLMHFVSDETLMETLGKDTTFPRHLFASMVTEETGAKLKPNVCAHLGPEDARSMDGKAFAKVVPECFGAVKPEFFEGVDKTFFSNINPSAFSAMTAAQAAKVPIASVKKMTKEQAVNFGIDPKPPVVTATSEAERKKQEGARKKYIDEHPCTPAWQWLTTLPSDTRVALNHRCAPLGNAAAVLTASLGMTLIFGGAAMVAFIL